MALGQMGAEVNGAKYYEAAQEIRAMGVTDEVEINRFLHGKDPHPQPKGYANPDDAYFTGD